MPSKIKKLSKHQIIRKHKKTKNARKKLLSKMRGGSAAAAASSTECFTPHDVHLVQIGIQNEDYLSAEPYDSTKTMYSDHAPIIYNLSKAPSPVTNPYVSIITWNVGMRGEEFESTDKITGEKRVSYTHKFKMKDEESINNYKKRLENLVNAMAELLDSEDNKPLKGNNHPFLFCQELPYINHTKSDSKDLCVLFKKLLSKKALGLLCETDKDKNQKYEFGLIVKMGSSSQRFTVLNQSEFQDAKYDNGSPVFPNTGIPDPALGRFEIYYYEFCLNTYYYVNIHARYTKKPREIVEFLKKIVDTIQVYRKTKKLGIDGVTIYLIGDYNFNIASPKINKLILTDYVGDPLRLFANPDLRRRITSMYKLTTQNAIGYSLKDNEGGKEPCNIDCILKLDLASVLISPV